MDIIAELVYKSYIPEKLEIGMLFMNKLYPGTDKEHVEIYALSHLPRDIDQFYVDNGFPIKFFIIEEGNLNSSEIIILATHDQIGWWDESDESDELYEVTLKHINNIFNDFDGHLSICIDEELEQPELLEERVIISYPYLFEEEEEIKD